MERPFYAADRHMDESLAAWERSEEAEYRRERREAHLRAMAQIANLFYYHTRRTHETV